MKYCFPILISGLILVPESTKANLLRRNQTLENDEKGKDAQDIFQGTQVTSSSEIPAFALMCFNGDTTCGGCGGVLVESNKVLTAAHCSPSSITAVRIGALTQTDGTFVEVSSQTTHPLYDSSNLHYDYAILTLASSVSTTPISYNTDTSYPDGTSTYSVTAYGFGGIDSSSTQSTVLRKASTTIVADSTCSGTFSSFSSSLQVCVTISSEGICQGDSGGPIIDSSGLLLGTLSYGTAACEDGTLDVWADPAAASGFISSGTISPTTTPAPTSAPSCSCFSETATVQVLEEEEPTSTSTIAGALPYPRIVAMKDLEVGQQIFAGLGEDNTPIYETVYGFAHRDMDGVAEYLHITTSCDDGNNNMTSCNTELEISPNHLIFVQGNKQPVAARSLVVGDVLIHQSPDQGETQPTRITNIQTVQKRGLYAPLTEDGTVIVDGIYASSYVSAHHLYPQLIDTITRFVSEHTLFHWWMAPYRIFCTHIAPRMCINDYSEEEGYILWLVMSRNLAEIFQSFSNLIIVAGLAVLLSVCGAFMMLETLLENPVFWLAQTVCTCFLCWRFSSSFPTRKYKALKVAKKQA